MNTVAECSIKLRVITNEKRYGCEVVVETGEMLCRVEPLYLYPNDVVYKALHQTAVLNNFSGCLNLS